MAGEHACSRCGVSLDDSTPDGYCLSCLLREGLGDSGEAKPAGAGQRFGNYELLEKIGQGGMGMVYRARQINLDRIVAVKLLPFGQFSSAEAVQRFQAEASAAAGLQHPNIVAIHDVGEQEGQPYFSMDFIEGRTLAEVVREKPLPAKRAATYLKTIAEAVHYAHEHGILHRDLKPSNILIDAYDQPRITDFGLAKRLSGDSDLTLTGQVLGSPNYLPPEQAGGKRAPAAPTGDVYSLGAILYHLLTGRPPFQADSLTTLLKQVLEIDPVAPRLLNPGVPRDLETICLKCLEKEGPRRYPTARELVEDLGRFLEDKPIQARPVNAVGRAWKWCRRQPARATLMGALAVVFALGLTGVLWQWQRARQNAQAELRQRERAEAGEYAADMRLAQLALADNNHGLAVSLLNKHRPARKSEIDLRHWEWRYLWQFCRGDELFTLHRYPRPVRAAAVSKDGKLLALATADEVAVWDLTTRKPLSGFPIATTRALAFSPTDRLLAVATWNATGPPGVDLWDLNGGKVTKTLKHDAEVRSLAFSPDGKLLATFDDRGSIKVVAWASDHSLTNFTVSQPGYTTAGVVAFSPDGNQLAIGEDYGRIRLLDLRRGTFVFPRTQLGAGVTALAFSPAANLLAAGYGYGVGTIRLWDPRSGEPLGQWTNHTDSVTSLAFTPDGRQLASASRDGTIRIWNAADHTELRCLFSFREGLTVMSMLPDGKTLVSGGWGGSVFFWDVTASNRAPAHTNWAMTLGFDSLAELDASSFAPATLDPRVVRRFGFAFTPDAHSFITLDADGSLALWDARSVRLAESLPALGSNHWGVALSPDGRWLATGDWAGKITIWDWPTRRAVTNFTDPCELYGTLGFSRSGNFLVATITRNNIPASVRLWRTGDWEEVPLTGSQSAGLLSVDLSPDDRVLAAGYRNGAVKLFRFPSGQPEATFTNHTEDVFGALFSPNGRVLISASADSSAKIWDVSARRELATLRGHLGGIGAGAFSPDGRRLATGGPSPRDAVKLWDLASHRELLNLQGEGQYFLHLTFSPDGNTLVATSLSGMIHLWRAPSWEEIEAAETKQKAP